MTQISNSDPRHPRLSAAISVLNLRQTCGLCDDPQQWGSS